MGGIGHVVIATDKLGRAIGTEYKTCSLYFLIKFIYFN